MNRTHHLITERLELRRFRESDAPAAHRNWMTDGDVCEFLTWSPHRDLEETRSVIRGWLRDYEAGSMDWCITLLNSDEPIGSITAVRDHPSEGYCELGYCLSKRYWDNGYMTEAIRAVVNYIFDITDYGWIQARYDTENEASGRCLEKCNFREVATVELPDPKTGRMRAYRMMAISRSDVFVTV